MQSKLGVYAIYATQSELGLCDLCKAFFPPIRIQIYSKIHPCLTEYVISMHKTEIGIPVCLELPLLWLKG